MYKTGATKDLTAQLRLRDGVGFRTLTGAVTCDTRTETICFWDPGGASRNVTLPPEATSNGLFFVVVNEADAAENLVLLDDGAVTVCTLNQGEWAIVACDGTTWRDVPLSALSDYLATANAWSAAQTFQNFLVGAASELTVATGVVAATRSYHTIDTEADAASDDLDSITGGGAGEVLFVRAENAARTVVLKHAIGANLIACPGGADISLAESTDWALLLHNGTQWTVVASSCLDQRSGAYVARGTIAFAAVRTLNATPVTMVAAPGAGKFIDVESVHWFLDYGTAAYDAAAAGDTLEAKYTNGAGAAVVDAVAGNVIGAASADYHALVRPVLEVVPVANAPIVAHVNNGEWYSAAGDSPLKWEMQYRIRTLDFV